MAYSKAVTAFPYNTCAPPPPPPPTLKHLHFPSHPPRVVGARSASRGGTTGDLGPAHGRTYIKKDSTAATRETAPAAAVVCTLAAASVFVPAFAAAAAAAAFAAAAAAAFFAAAAIVL